jgi:hypothetical protein
MMANQGFGFKQTVLNRPVNQMDPGYINCSIMTSDDVCKLSNRKLKKVLIIGDSHAGSITATILKNASPYGSVDSFLRSGCQYVNYINTIKFKPEFQYCYEYSKNVEQIVKDGNYDLIIAHYRSSTLNPILNKGWKYYTKIKIESLSQLANTYQLNVVLLGPTPEFPSKPQFFDPNRLLIEGSEIPSKLISRQDMNQIPFLENEEYKKFEYLNPFTIKYIDLIDNFCNYKNCSRWDSGWLYSDIDHLSALGAEKIDKDLKQLFGIN